MKPATAIAFTLILMIGVSASAQGSWSTHTSAGEYAFARGDLDRAESEFRAALDIAQGFPAGDRRLETSLENLARLVRTRVGFRPCTAAVSTAPRSQRAFASARKTPLF